jgi:hypothetical protein
VDGRENETVEGRESPGKDESSTFTVCAAILIVGIRLPLKLVCSNILCS